MKPALRKGVGTYLRLVRRVPWPLDSRDAEYHGCVKHLRLLMSEFGKQPVNAEIDRQKAAKS